MLPKKHRLNRSSDVKKTTLKGRSFFNPLFVIKAIPNNQKVRLTVIASVKVSKKAVTRNYLKRVVRHFVQENLTSFKNADYAVILKPAAATVSKNELVENLGNTAIKGKIFK